MKCDGSSDCADGDDEEGCDDFVCSGALRCRLDNICIHPIIDICDGVIHCLLSGDDESYCDMFSCPRTCVCRGSVHTNFRGLIMLCVIVLLLLLLLLHIEEIGNYSFYGLLQLTTLDLSSYIIT